ncbi:cytochrome P450 [Streptosporangium sp. NBC_01755]|uniref:cytochrome P450 n=1 Tax=unclassified Streptosporangium TaxID=2632669 RepID=UPI002DD7D477|nr:MULTISPECIES: cytochrome P450 [unclassified Streptosporangium]WSA27268.1 cytochrome P450 [Streptosporangium sp. NBC_01810]WSD01179.1 cytochrome P450 [Streptosporangium sp. NBC_01755]
MARDPRITDVSKEILSSKWVIIQRKCGAQTKPQEARMDHSEVPALGARGCLGQLNPLIRRLRDTGPIVRVRTPVGDEAWLVTRLAELKQLLLDDRLGTTHPDPPNRARYLDNPMLDLIVSDQDPADARRTHHALRSSLTPYFSAKRIAGMRSRVGAVADEHLDAILAKQPPVDMHTEFSLPFSYQILCDLLGVADPAEYQAVLDRISSVGAGLDQVQELFGYLGEVAERKRVQPGDDLASALCQAGLPDEFVGALLAFVTMSYQVTPHSISAAIGLFATNPDQHKLVLEDPELLPGAVEEALRMSKFAESALPRYASADIEIGGVTIRAGDLVLCDHGSTAFDDRVFEDPERFDVTRSPNPHLVFSHGMTYCIGAPLARLEISEVLARLLPRLPSMRLAIPIGDIPVSGELSEQKVGGGIAQLPITWDLPVPSAY